MKFIIVWTLAIFAWVFTAPCTGHAQSFEDVFTIQDSLELEQGDDAFLSVPYVSLLEDGNMLIVEPREQRVFRYNRSGALQSIIGSPGQGPGEFRIPVTATQTAAGSVLVGELGGGFISVFDSSNTFVERHTGLLWHALQLHALDAERVLAVGPKEQGTGASPLLHIFNASTGEIEDSFFPHPTPIGTYGNVLNGISDIATADVRAGQTVVAFAPEPRLYTFSTDGDSLSAVDVSLQHFIPVDPSYRGADLSNREVQDAYDSFSRIHDLFWMHDDLILVQYYDIADQRTNTLNWHLAGVTRSGDVLFDIANTPRLYAVDTSTGGLFFNAPDTLDPGQWVVAALKNSW
ncbi:hypothetical protein CRI93_03870 [Longimonas halophila]|uniref:6-bladed beta-propeller n=1 Tax=Longimonas halophila TaxID=1469170 RepID=A0A2H3NPE1_9BACT|nr:hypothetical protein [Longimonas halophila]PEN08894.1 hypothetical protein CRI93_03870 [Longimonas halophila]